MFGYIYITYNKLDGRIYIGQKQGEYCKSYYGGNENLKKDIKKFGKENFENHLIEYTFSKEGANKKEKDQIAKYNCTEANGYGYNIAAGGVGKGIYEHMSDERREKMKQNKIKGYRNMSEKAKKERAEKIGKAHKGTKHSDETKLKMSIARVGTHVKEETKRKMSEKAKLRVGKNASNAKTIDIVYKGKSYSFDTRTEAVEYFKTKYDMCIINWLRNKVPKAYKNDVTFIKVKDKIVVNLLK